MSPDIIIRKETREDFRAISDGTTEAFATLEISNHTEQFIIEALRAAGALAISLVAELGGRVVGHIAFSSVSMSDGTTGWFGLGPVSVLPEVFFALPFEGQSPQGMVTFHEAFMASGPAS
ncbi:N-acetyltransferase [Chlorobaculum sp. MV4-Y]|jgi:putative acetyltransferase|uniref:GNAT family N-acetyltransferase n=1 Tax=Chlorobaculum sp. MV4-Y TaxID=2976335 RepID=UPI0021AECA25|nr:N-acetyltransferase [Chlorobaculum sp. MV4-Y]UWX57626.1 N-acetyltransferase [Chlorobaculum sp. MV4-Y]